MAILQHLAEHQGEIVSRDTLFELFWQNQVVTNDALNRTLSTIRKAFRDNANSPQYIATIRNQGYKLIAPVTMLPDSHIERHQSSLSSQRQNNNLQFNKWLLMTAVLLMCVMSSVLFMIPSEPHQLRLDSQWKRLTYSESHNSQPQLSSDGQYFIYIAQATNKASNQANTTAKQHNRIVVTNQLTNQLHHIDAGNSHFSYPVINSINDSENQLTAIKTTAQAISVVSYSLNPDINDTNMNNANNEKTLFELSSPSEGLSWHPKQHLIAYTQPHPHTHKPLIYTRHTKLNRAQALTDAEYALADTLPQFSPNGQHLAFIRSYSYLNSALFITDLQGNQRKISDTMHQINAYCWLSNNSLLLNSNEQFVRIQLDGQSSSVRTSQRDGRLNSMFCDNNNQRVLVGYGASHAQLSSFKLNTATTKPQLGHLLTRSQTQDFEGAVSHNRKDLAFISTRSAQNMLWLRRGNTIIPVTETQTTHLYGLDWSPNDHKVAMIGVEQHHTQIITFQPDTKQANTKQKISYPLGPTPAMLIGWQDNQHILYSQYEQATWWLKKLDTHTGKSHTLSLQNTYQARLTPDKRRLVYLTPQSNRFWLWDFVNPAQEIPPQPNQQINRNWFVDNEHVYYFANSQKQALVTPQTHSSTQASSSGLFTSDLWQLSLYNDQQTLIGRYDQMSPTTRPQKSLFSFINSTSQLSDGDIWTINWHHDE